MIAAIAAIAAAAAVCIIALAFALYAAPATYRARLGRRRRRRRGGPDRVILALLLTPKAGPEGRARPRTSAPADKAHRAGQERPLVAAGGQAQWSPW